MKNKEIEKAYITGLKQRDFDCYMWYKEIETIMDNTNSDYGSKEEYCIYCKSKLYNSQVGIIHKQNCIIINLRKKIKQFENKK